MFKSCNPKLRRVSLWPESLSAWVPGTWNYHVDYDFDAIYCTEYADGTGIQIWTSTFDSENGQYLGYIHSTLYIVHDQMDVSHRAIIIAII